MWESISNNNDISRFMEKVFWFHDSCIKEMNYISGAYVDNNISMFPLNNRRILRVIVQRQSEENSMIEMEFQGLKCLKLIPIDECYTCEIVDSTMIMKDGNIYWYDGENLLAQDLDSFTGTITGTLICASKLRWRPIENHMGEKEFYHSAIPEID